MKTRILPAIIVVFAALQLPTTVLAEDSLEYSIKPNLALDSIQHNQLDTLFDALREAETELEAKEHANEIWRIWVSPKDEKLKTLMDKAIAQVTDGNLAESLETLDVIVKDFPKYAEGWNQRATVNYLLSNLSESMDDINKTLKLEPRHFGALAGRSMIHLKRGESELAEASLLQAMQYHPFLPGRDLLLDAPDEESDNDLFYSHSTFRTVATGRELAPALTGTASFP